MGIVALILCFLYFYMFHGGLSTDPSDWDAFGSFFSAVASIANLVFFIIITIHVAQIQDQTSKSQIIMQKNLYILEYKWRAFHDLNLIIDSLQKIPKKLDNNIKQIYEEAANLQREIDLFEKRNSKFFEKLDFDTVKQTSNRFFEYVNTIKHKTTFTDADAAECSHLLKSVDTCLIVLAQKIQDNILEHENNMTNNKQGE